MSARVRLRIYSEDLPLAEVADPRVLGELGARGIELIVAVRPWTLAELPPVLRAAREHGVAVTVWPMLGDHDGRWASAVTAARFAAFTREVVERTDAREVLIDLEPPIARVRRAIDGVVPTLGRARGDAAPLVELIAELGVRDVRTTAAAIPLVLADRRAGRFQRWLGTPVDDVAYSTVSTMAYTSLFEGYSRRLLRRADARALLAVVARHTARRFGTRAALSLGAVAVGALGDERPYRGPDELADDVAIARHEGIRDLSLFDLRGVLARTPIEPWLDALAHQGTTRAALTLRVRASVAALAVAGW